MLIGNPPTVVVMGVSGSGKTTVGVLLAAQLGVPFADADDFHSDEAKAKMAVGHALDDSDRAPWLLRLAEG
jgi:gluconokinase